MTQKSKIQRVTPEELPYLLKQLNVEKTTHLALIGPDVPFPNSFEDWDHEIQDHLMVLELSIRLSIIPSELFLLSQLTSLDLSGNKIGPAGAEAIVRNLRHLTALDLNSNWIGYAGSEAIGSQLHQLTSLNLSNNHIGVAGAKAIAGKLHQLTSLDLSGNDIGVAGTRDIVEHFSQLTSLNLSSNGIGDVEATAIAEHLSQLTSLDLGDNVISDIGVTAIAGHLSQLTSLDLSDNVISDTGAMAIAGHLSQLTSLNLSNNNIGVASVKEIAGQLHQLTSLDLSGNDIGDAGAEAIAGQLHQLTSLNLSGNDIGDAGTEAIGKNLARLTSLTLPLINVTDLSPLKSLILSGVPVKYNRAINGQGIYVDNACPLKTPPMEIIRQGPEAVLYYFLEREVQGTDRLFEAKLLIVGEGGAGKTSLLRRMFQPEMELPKEDETTHGIDIFSHEFSIYGDHTFRLNAWDFGGQQIYHATHQFFLTKRSLYVLVDDTRTDAKSIHDEGFKFWLEVVETLSEGSPLLVFQNEKGGRSKKIDKAGIKGRFVNVKEFYRGNLEHLNSADDLRRAVEHFAQQLEHIGDDVPAKWIDIRKDIEELSKTRPHITLDEYLAVYSNHLEFDREKALHLSQYFHDLGVFLHFHTTSELRRTVFLQNKWVTDAVFRILDDEEVKANRGRFTVDDCDRLWADEGYASKDVELRALMERFELAYRLPDMLEETWLVPQHLSPSKPTELGEWAKTGDLVLTYRYEFLPRGLVSRLMVRMHRFVKQPDLCWSHGALFEHGNTQVLVETGARGNEITIRSRGPLKQYLLSVIASDLDALNDSFKGLKDKVSKLVPCICKTCKKLKEPAMFEQKELIDRKNRGKLTIECPKPPEYYDVSVIELLEGMDLKQWLEKARQELLPEIEAVGFAIAVSFPGEHRAFVLKIVEQLANELGRERIFYDEWYEARLLGTGGDLKLQECYKQAKLVVPFFSEHYSKPWCSMEWETIRGILLNRRQDDAVIPIHLDETEVPGWSAVNFGIKPKGRSAEEIAKLILEAYRIRQ